MNPIREQLLKDRAKYDFDLFERIKNVANPDALDLWALSPERFVEWRKLHDFPKLLTHFDKTLVLFQEWKAENKLTNEIIISVGHITPFIENKTFSKNNTLYLTKQTFKGKSKKFVSFEQLEGEKIQFDEKYNFELIQPFTSYLDWLKSKGEKEKILKINSRHSPNSDYERVFIHADVYARTSDFELLKMGGIPIPVNGFNLLFRGKELEFVNLCGLKLNGDINFGELGNLSCSYSACDNWVAENFSLPLVKFKHCSITNFTITNSKIQNWLFYNCHISGDFINTKLTTIRIYGGNFRPILQDCTLLEVDVLTDNHIEDNNYYAYKTLKTMYANQGDDERAKSYFIKEHEFLRKSLKGFNWNYLTKSLSFYYWEYGRKPHRIIYISIITIFLFGFVYWLNKDLIALNSSKITDFNLLDAFYFSTTTFTTLGYGDLSPLSGLRILTSIEAFMGLINTGFLIAGYSNNKY